MGGRSYFRSTPRGGNQASAERCILEILMDEKTNLTNLRKLRRKAIGRYRKWSVDRKLPSMPKEAIVPLEETEFVLLLCSRFRPFVPHQAHVSELAFANALAEAGYAFAVTQNAYELFDKHVVWYIPGGDHPGFVEPRLWDYSRQVHDFVLGLERQGNDPFCSAHETAFWENKAHMHEELDRFTVPTPKTVILTSENWKGADFDFEPVLVKDEHSSGSVGIHHFTRAEEAKAYVARYRFRRHESLIMQEVIRGATRDMRVTMVGDKLIRSATYWRTKSPEALSDARFTTTATGFGSLVSHSGIPADVEPFCAEIMRKLSIRTAGIDLMWPDDDVSEEPQVLELSPYYQPNPPKPERYRDWTYREYKKKRRNIPEGYLLEQYGAFREIADETLRQNLL